MINAILISYEIVRYLNFLSGGVSLLWSLIWVLFVSNDPQKDKFISKEEREFLKEQIVVPLEKVGNIF